MGYNHPVAIQNVTLCVSNHVDVYFFWGLSIAFEWWWERHSHFFTKSCSAHTHSHTQTPVDIEWAQASERAKERTQNIHTYMYITIERVLLSSPLMPLRYVKELLKWAGFGFVCFVLYAHINTSIGAMNKPMWCLWFNACTKHSLASSKSYTKQFVSRHQIYICMHTHSIMIFDFFLLFGLINHEHTADWDFRISTLQIAMITTTTKEKHNQKC